MKKILAILLAAALLFSFAACGKEDTTAEDTTTAAAEDVETTVADAIEEETTIADAAEETTAADAEATTVADAEATTVAGEEATTAANAETTATAVATTAAAMKAPQTKAEILAAYNNAVNSAYNAKAGFDKERYADNANLDAKGALSALTDVVYTFMGIGEGNEYTEKVEKGKWDSDLPHHYLRKSTLTEADLTNATCKESGGKYTIVLSVKGGTSKGSKDEKFTKAPIDKCGICVGDEDKGYYDHKTGPVIYDALDDIYGSAIIEESYDNAKVTAVVDAATGHIVSLTVEYDITCSINVGIVGSGNATGTAHILYKNFKY